MVRGCVSLDGKRGEGQNEARGGDGVDLAMAGKGEKKRSKAEKQNEKRWMLVMSRIK